MLTLFTAVPAAAQLDWGIKAGVNLAEKPTDLEFVKGKAGWYVGPMVKVQIPVVGLGIEANLLYSQTNTEVNDVSIKRQSIDLPVYLRYELSIPAINKFLEPFLAAGPQWSWNIGDKEYTVGSLLEKNYKLRDSNLSFNLGLGAVVLDHLQLHVNYNIALGSTSDYETVAGSVINAIDNIKSKTNTWQVSVGYFF